MVLVVSPTQVRGRMLKELGKSAAIGTATTLVVGAIAGGGVMVTSLNRAVWCVVTSDRLLLIEREVPRKRQRQVLLAAPRAALAAQVKTLVWSEVRVTDRSDDQIVLRLNFGFMRPLARKVAAAVSSGGNIPAGTHRSLRWSARSSMPLASMR